MCLQASQRKRDVVGIYHTQPVHFRGIHTTAIDLAEVSRFRALVEQKRPKWVIHCAALTDVDACQSDPGSAFTANAVVSGQVAAAAAAVDAGIVYISTDAFWDGPGPHRESDVTSPLNFYTVTKLVGEDAVQAANPRSLIVRTNIFGWSPVRRRKLAEWVLEELEAGRDVPGFVDVHFNPLLANDLADILIEMTDRNITGLYNVASSEIVTKYAFAVTLATEFGYDAARVKVASIAATTPRALRPRDTSLDVARISRLLGHAMPTVADGVRGLRRLRDTGYLERLNASISGEFG